MCPRCTSKYDLSRALRCPICGTGAVYPVTREYRDDTSGLMGPCSSLPGSGSSGAAFETIAGRQSRDSMPASVDAVGVSPCTECGGVPTQRWLASAVRVEESIAQSFQRVVNASVSSEIAAEMKVGVENDCTKVGGRVYVACARVLKVQLCVVCEFEAQLASGALVWKLRSTPTKLRPVERYILMARVQVDMPDFILSCPCTHWSCKTSWERATSARITR